MVASGGGRGYSGSQITGFHLYLAAVEIFLPKAKKPMSKIWDRERDSHLPASAAAATAQYSHFIHMALGLSVCPL